MPCFGIVARRPTTRAEAICSLTCLVQAILRGGAMWACLKIRESSSSFRFLFKPPPHVGRLDIFNIYIYIYGTALPGPPPPPHGHMGGTSTPPPPCGCGSCLLPHRQCSCIRWMTPPPRTFPGQGAPYLLGGWVATRNTGPYIFIYIYIYSWHQLQGPPVPPFMPWMPGVWDSWQGRPQCE